MDVEEQELFDESYETLFPGSTSSSPTSEVMVQFIQDLSFENPKMNDQELQYNMIAMFSAPPSRENDKYVMKDHPTHKWERKIAMMEQRPKILEADHITTANDSSLGFLWREVAGNFPRLSSPEKEEKEAKMYTLALLNLHTKRESTFEIRICWFRFDDDQEGEWHELITFTTPETRYPPTIRKIESFEKRVILLANFLEKRRWGEGAQEIYEMISGFPYKVPLRKRQPILPCLLAECYLMPLAILRSRIQLTCSHLRGKRLSDEKKMKKKQKQKEEEGGEEMKKMNTVLGQVSIGTEEVVGDGACKI